MPYYTHHDRRHPPDNPRPIKPRSIQRPPHAQQQMEQMRDLDEEPEPDFPSFSVKDLIPIRSIIVVFIVASIIALIVEFVIAYRTASEQLDSVVAFLVALVVVVDALLIIVLIRGPKAAEIILRAAEPVTRFMKRR